MRTPFHPISDWSYCSPRCPICKACLWCGSRPLCLCRALPQPQAHPRQYEKVLIQPGCVGVSQGPMTMKTSSPGNSASGVGEQIYGNARVEWTVQCYTLPFLFSHWGLTLGPAVFIKIDVESYECKLIPSLVEWFMSVPVKPTLHIAMHDQIVKCSDGEYQIFRRLVDSYRYATCRPHELIPGKIPGVFPCTTGELLLSDKYKPVA